ncbi:hypothetical protein C1H46_044351 [Malus baccata]|uniref:Uncharacterized protein n=1 Tax=Malus baccata TaxID=106549 RepID=A0A540K7A9_MALBA|nr:hypothetical protein C1H46_044351 [Malus baccata]
MQGLSDQKQETTQTVNLKVEWKGYEGDGAEKARRCIPEELRACTSIDIRDLYDASSLLRLATSCIKAITWPFDCDDDEALLSRHLAFPISRQ